MIIYWSYQLNSDHQVHETGKITINCIWLNWSFPREPFSFICLTIVKYHFSTSLLIILINDVALDKLATNFSHCVYAQTGTHYSHGELLTLSGSCVDQKCLCVNGRWHCLDYCVPMKQLPCSAQSIIVWDPFCCPRCPGEKVPQIKIKLSALFFFWSPDLSKHLKHSNRTATCRLPKD